MSCWRWGLCYVFLGFLGKFEDKCLGRKIVGDREEGSEECYFVFY